jgi:hypothetical protein
MEVKEFVKKVIGVKIDGTLYECHLPSVKDVKEFSKKVKALEDPNDSDLPLIELLVKLGLPKEKLEEMDIETLEELSELFVSKKKK